MVKRQWVLPVSMESTTGVFQSGISGHRVVPHLVTIFSLCQNLGIIKNVLKLTGETSGEAEVASVETKSAGPHRPVIGQCCAIQKNSGKGEGSVH